MAAFSGVLWSRMPRLVGFIFGYAFLGTLITASIFGRKLAHLTFATLRREGDLRFDLVRTRENAEAIAFYGGGSRERRTAHHKLDKLVKVRRSAILWSAGLSLWTNVYSYATILVPSVMCAPLYFAGKMQFGVISQVTTSFNHIEAALNFLVNHLARVSALAAVSARLETLQDALVHARGSGPKIGRETVEVTESESDFGDGNDGKEALAPPPPPPPPQTILRLSSLTVCTPAGGRTLTTSLDLELRAGQSLLIVGPSGCGKSSLLRAVAGLWCRGGGGVAAPHPRRCFFLPQKTYMPLGPLRDQLIFPADSKALARAAAEASRREQGMASPLAAAIATIATTTRATDDGSHPSVDPSLADDSKLLDLLDAVALPQLAGAVGGLDADVEWGHVLSLGEQQRVAAARLLAARPALAFLDEATSAMDAASEARIYAAVAQACRRGCYVSVGHRPELARYHSHVLESAGGGQWRLVPARQWSEERRARALAEAALEGDWEGEGGEAFGGAGR
jgi:putative ATP-binding cassette transporter